jgi:hypothetical protein
MKTLSYDFDHKIQRMKDLVNTTNTNLIRYQNSVDSQITHGTNKISIHTATKLREIATMASEQSHKYSIDIGDTVRKYHGQFGETITTGINRLQDQYNTFENTLGRNIESALDYVDREIEQYKTSVKELAHRANGIHGANANGERVNSGANKHEIKRNPQFPNVNMAAIQNIPKPRNPCASDEENLEQSENEWDRFGPSDTAQKRTDHYPNYYHINL